MEEKKGASPLFQLLSTAFRNGGQIPEKYASMSPALAWTGQPRETKSFALVMEDIDAPGGTKVHWMLYGFGPEESGVEAGVAKKLNLPNGMRQGRNDFGETGYTGPNPPKGISHRYSFKLYACSKMFVLKMGADKRDFRKAVQAAGVTARAELVGRFKSEGAAVDPSTDPRHAVPATSEAEIDQFPPAVQARLDALENDKSFSRENDRLQAELKEMYASYPTEVTKFFKQFSFVSPFAQGKVQEYLGTIAHRDLRVVLGDYVKFANQYRIQLRLRTDPVRFKKILWPEYGNKFQVKIVDDHFEPAGPYSEEEPYAESFEAPKLKVLEEVQKLIDTGQATFVQIDDGPGYSQLKDLESMARKDDGVTIFLHNAEQPYLGCIFGWKMLKGLLADMGKPVTEFQRVYYGFVPSGRPPKDLKKTPKTGQQASSNKGKAAESGNNDPTDKKTAGVGLSGLHEKKQNK